DQVLRAVAARLRVGMSSSDIVARFGGDEFVIVRTGVSTIDAAKQLGERAMAILRHPVTIIDRDLQLTISVGVALSTPADSPDSLLRDVDDAMFEAKRDGRNRVTAFDDSARARAHRRQSLAASLPLALERDELHLEYQPIVRVASLETAGFEALLRWEHPDLGTILPEEFVPIAETSGLILQIGAWVLERASRQVASWRADERVPPGLWMAVNLSASQLAQPHLADHVEAIIREAGAPAAAIHLEIAESVLMDRIDNALNTIVELQAVGVSVSIDDFGTGYSSLSYLSRLPVDTIKIDRSFVSGLGGAGHGTSIIRATIALADTLDLDVVAEGVELAGQLELLRELGCTYAQGFIWSHSLRPDAALEWMTERTTTLRGRDESHVAAGSPSSAKPPVDVGQAIVDIAHTSGGRRRTSADLANVLRFDSLEVGLNARKAWLAGREIDLTVKEFDLLAFLTEHAGRVFSRTELLHEVWHSSPEWQNPATVTEHVHRLRSRIEPDPNRPRLIFTVRGRGYCFGSEVVAVSA
ncbi:MAG TPA: EAL domain-containing protein, partial [Ilumatobacteraceae bacterium]|nr:EAL domain-containing protein [Ilumatobacteraceae bacterium]